MIYYLAIMLFLLSAIAEGDITITGSIRDLKVGKVYLYKYKDVEPYLLDSAQTINGSFSFNLKEDGYVGFYRIKLNDKTSLQLISNKENINFSSNINNLTDGIKFTESKENQIYYDYLRVSKAQKNKSQLLSNLKYFYTSDDPFYQQLILQENRAANEKRELVQHYNREYSNTFALKVIKSQFIQVNNKSLSNKEQTEHNKLHYWDNFDFKDTTILNSDIVPNKVFEFSSLYNESNLSEEAQEDSLIKAFNIILAKASVNETFYAKLLKKMVKDVEKSNYEKLYVYLNENYVIPELCSNDSLSNVIFNRMENMKRVAIGNVAPDIEFGGKKLSSMKSKCKLVVFWSSWCSHCNTSLEELKSVYSEFRNKDFEVLAVSVDSDSAAYAKAIQERGYNWLNYAEFRGWHGLTPVNYNVTATPTMFLLDENNTIISKPHNIVQLKIQLESRLKN